VAKKMTVEVDRLVCIGSGDCVRVAPATFALDDEDVAVVLDPSASTLETLQTAERSCPSGAIRLVEAGA
jgi:ferredoxin